MRLIPLIFILFIWNTTYANEEKCAVLCRSEYKNELTTLNRHDIQSWKALPTTKPKNYTHLNCDDPVFICLQNERCNSSDIKLTWIPSKEYKLPSKELAVTCETSPNLGNFFKIYLKNMFPEDGSFVFKKNKNSAIYYYKAITGE